MYLYFSIGNSQPREPALCQLHCSLLLLCAQWVAVDLQRSTTTVALATRWRLIILWTVSAAMMEKLILRGITVEGLKYCYTLSLLTSWLYIQEFLFFSICAHQFWIILAQFYFLCMYVCMYVCIHELCLCNPAFGCQRSINLYVCCLRFTTNKPSMHLTWKIINVK